MPPIPTSETAELEPGGLLGELERRQDEVLEQLEALDAQITHVLRGLGVTVDE